MDPLLQAALKGDEVTLFGAVKIEFPSGDVRFLDGAARITFGGETYLGLDPVFGALDSIDVITEGSGDQQPEIGLSLSPPDISAAATLANADMQGSIVTISAGAVDPATGQSIGAPEVKFLGEVDVPTMALGPEGRVIEYTILSVFQRLFEVDEGIRASDGWHQSVWPGEKGFEFMTGTDKNLYWGGKRPNGYNIVSGGGGNVNSGGGLFERLSVTYEF